jgi:hypothetical protein
MANTLPPPNGIKPVPNNLTLVRFGPLEIDFTAPVANYTLGQLEYDEQTFIPTAAFVEYTNVIGAITTAAAITIDNGTDSENIVASTNLVATVLTPNNSTANLSNQILSIASPSYVLGGLPVANGVDTGAASTQQLRVKVTTTAVPTLTSVSHYTANNISTINVSSVPASYTPGSTIRVKSATTTTYNGVFQITAVTGTSISFYNPNVTTEGTSGSPTADTTAKIGACTGNVYVVGLLQ